MQAGKHPERIRGSLALSGIQRARPQRGEPSNAETWDPIPLAHTWHASVAVWLCASTSSSA